MARRRSVVIALALLALVAAAALLAHPAPWIAWAHPEVRWMSRDALAARLASTSPPTLLDARSEAEVAVSTIEGAIRVDSEAPDLAAVSRDAEVVVYCSIGVRSARVAEQLRASGHARVWSLEGGIFEWANEGRPLWRGRARTRLVHPYDALWGLLLRADRRAPITTRDARASAGS